MTLIHLLLRGISLIFLVATARAQVIQPLSCTAQAAGIPSMRAEGVAELLGEVLIICSGGNAAAPTGLLAPATLRVTTSPGIDITSRLAPNGLTESLLFVDEPVPQIQNPCGNATSAPYTARPGSGQTVATGVCGSHVGSPTGNGLGTYDPSNPSPAVSVSGTDFPTYRPNAFQARRVSNNILEWQFPFEAPGILTARILRVTNVRANVAQLGVPPGQTATVQLSASLTLSSFDFPIANPSPTVGFVEPSLAFSVLDAATCLQQQSANAAFAANTSSALAQSNRCDGRASTIRFEERSPSVFRRRSREVPSPLTTGEAVPAPLLSQDVLGFPFNTETGTYKAAAGDFWPSTLQSGQTVAGLAPGVPGLADAGTRLVIRFHNVPNGVAIWLGVSVPVNSLPGSMGTGSLPLRTGTARLIQTDGSGAGAFGQLGPTAVPANLRTVASASAIPLNYNNDGLHRVLIQGGSGVAVYEIVNADVTVRERVEIPVVYAFAANTAALGTAAVSGDLGPLSTISTASETAPVPRFADTGLNRTTLLTITNAGVPSVQPPSPSAGSALTNTFTFQFDDPDGAGDLSVLNVLIHSALDGRNSCYLAYVPSGPTAGTVLLVNDNGDAGGPFAGALTLPGSGTIANSQCQINGTGSSAAMSGVRLTLTLSITFKAPYAGRKVVYQAARDQASNNSGWSAKGVWRVPGAAPTSPRVDTITPVRDSAGAVTITTTFSDDDGFADLNILNLLINSAIEGRQACYLAFIRPAGLLALVNDAGDAGGPFAGTISIPGGGTASNSQCRVDAALSNASGASNTMTLTLRITFLPSFKGDRIVYAAGRDALENNSGWQAMATVSVP